MNDDVLNCNTRIIVMFKIKKSILFLIKSICEIINNSLLRLSFINLIIYCIFDLPKIYIKTLENYTLMNTKFYLLFTLLFFQSILAQNSEPVGNTPEAKVIDKQLNEIFKKSKTFVDPKYETELLRLKSESKKADYDWGVLRSGNYLTSIYLGMGEDQKTIDLANELKEVARNKKDLYGHISSIYRRNALALGYLGLRDESFKDFQKAIEYAKQIENHDKKMQLLSFAYENINVYYENRGKERAANDSMLVNYKKSLEMAKNISDRDDVVHIDQKYDLIAYMNMRLGLFYLEHELIKDYLPLAEKYLLDAQKIYENKEYDIDPANKAQTLNNLSRLYIAKKEYHKAIECAERALDYEKSHSYPMLRKNSYEFLLQAYLEINDTEKSKFYRDKYKALNDSLDYVKRGEANSTMSEMVTKVDMKHEENSKKQWLITGVLALMAGIIVAVMWRRRNKTLRKNYEQIIEKLKNPEFNTLENTSDDKDNNELITDEDEVQNDPSVNRNVISKETETRILKRLETFERSEKFLKKDLTVSMLSAQLNINSKYLSEIIKNNKSINFNGYINTLRINYIVHKLYTEPKFRTYKISYLAELSGYASPQVFVTAFKKITGVTPSYFLQNLEEDNI